MLLQPPPQGVRAADVDDAVAGVAHLVHTRIVPVRLHRAAAEMPPRCRREWHVSPPLGMPSLLVESSTTDHWPRGHGAHHGAWFRRRMTQGIRLAAAGSDAAGAAERLAPWDSAALSLTLVDGNSLDSDLSHQGHLAGTAWMPAINPSA